ncbi:leucine-rich repeat protein [Talaromyces proteolyticus]|uniref:Leucine-rich repeat protein n=1 Tax=Talaromyces proteolyticus TaxID=1131652 RepID=A0AAD4KJY7_9EURO|nr:leucine-rich repeat protein [Talaromyces proteolyticus]KAH8690947.1 leucine-rich repeat protein [Talaromyces proteolyticus]
MDLNRSSGIPRPVSRIPLPTSTRTRSIIRPSPSRERLQADSGVDIHRLRRPSQEALRRKSSAQYIGRRESVPALESFTESSESPVDSDGGLTDDHNERQTPSRPSLSDRTVETLSRIPPSPSPRSRRSSFFPPDNIMGPPLRSASSMNDCSRSPSRSSQHNGSDDVVVPQPTFARRASSRHSLMASKSRDTMSQRISDKAGDKLSVPNKSLPRQSFGLEKRRSIVGLASSKHAETLPLRSATVNEEKGLVTKIKSRPSLSSAFVKPMPNEVSHSPISVKKTRKPSSNLSSNVTSPSSTVSKASSLSSDPATIDPGMEVRKASKSSNALRESIAKAKAARKASRQSNVNSGTIDGWDGVDTQDPFNQLPKGSNDLLLQKRVEAARTSGSLNIAALGLSGIPDEVMTMYDYDPNSGSEWYESVDLVKFIAADNELVKLPEEAFPDIDPQDFDMDDDSKGNQFGGLEVLDLHGNVLQSLPIGMRRLQRLTSLNLSSNQLKMEDIEMIAEIKQLADLKLANNKLDGPLPAIMGQLENLEVLDLHENHITILPDSLSGLKSLKKLNVADNDLATLPFEYLKNLPIIELNAARNKLQGALIRSTLNGFESLQLLNVAYNSLESLSNSPSFDFPNLQVLLVDANRLKSLPTLSVCRSLLRISAEGNRISVLPDGFLELESLKHVDLTANDLSKLDERVGLMHNLISFRIANNPLRERKFLTMDTEDLKNDLRTRCAPSLLNGHAKSPETGNEHGEYGYAEDDEEGSVATEFTLAPESPSHLNRWRVKSGGILDRSATEMTDLDVAELRPLLSSHDIKCLYIQRNKLQAFPCPALNLISSTLVDLDLSKNPLQTSDLFSEALNLPQLQSLTLNGCGLTDVEPLFHRCDAPALKFLDISNNRLSGPLPFARQHFQNLITFLAADNQITGLEFEHVRGLQVLDVSNNNIDFLPPRIGLLGGDRSILKRFEVAGNTFRVPRWPIVQKGTEAVLEWLKGKIPADELNDWEIGNGSSEV